MNVGINVITIQTHGIKDFPQCDAFIEDDMNGKARRALATFVAQLFSCTDGEHCFI
jgi:hypothetical protein